MITEFELLRGEKNHLERVVKQIKQRITLDNISYGLLLGLIEAEKELEKFLEKHPDVVWRTN